MKKTNFLIMIAVLILVFASWLVAQYIVETATDPDQASGRGSYQGPKEEAKAEPLCHNDLVCLESPAAGETVGSPLLVKGRARGNWYFEADFPIILTDWDGRVIAQGHASAQDDWMTEDFVEFFGRLEFTADTRVSNRGALILQKDNPSGLPENDDALEIEIYLK